MKPLEPGTPFEISLPEGGYAFGYVSYYGYGPGTANCVLHNIFDFRADSPDAMEQAFDKPLLIRDMLNEASMHSRTKVNLKNDTYWKPNSKKRVPGARLPKYDRVAGTGVRQIWTGEVELRKPTEEERVKFPEWRLASSTFYPLYILGKMTDRVVVLVEKVKDEAGKTIKPAHFALRTKADLGGLTPYRFHGAADT